MVPAVAGRIVRIPGTGGMSRDMAEFGHDASTVFLGFFWLFST